MELVGGSPQANPIHDFAWYRRHLYIQERMTHALVKLNPTPIQLRVRKAILDQERADEPSRIIVLKARREGVSTITQATFAHRAFTRRNVKAYTISHDADSASILFGMTEQMYHNLPAPLRPDKVPGGNVGRRLKLVNGADLRTETAGDVKAGRASAATLLHCSEVAFWDHGDDVLRSMLSIVPKAPRTVVLMESTANGVGNTFHKRWTSAELGESGYMPLFFSWLEDPIYWVDGATWEGLGPLDDEEEALKVVLGAGPEQLQWRRDVIRTDFDNYDLAGFHQEYPSTAAEAFITSGRQFFGAEYITRFHPTDPIRRARLVGKWIKGAGVTAERDERGPLWIYKPKEIGHRYVLFIDPAGTVGETRAQHFKNPEDVSDFTVMWVVDCQTFETVAVWHDRIDISLAGEVACKLGLIYNKAVICPETTGGYGWAIVQKLRDLGYGAIHRDRNRQTWGQERKDQYGWATTEVTRPIMLETLRSILRDHPGLLNHAPLKGEMQTFIIGKRREEAAPGCHDDLVFGAAGAYTVAAEYAQRRPIKPLDAATKKKAEQQKQRRRKRRRYEDVLSRAQR